MVVTFRDLLELSAGNFEFLSLGRREQIRDLRTFHPHIDRDHLGTMKPGRWLTTGDLVIASKFLMLRGDGRQARRRKRRSPIPAGPREPRFHRCVNDGAKMGHVAEQKWATVAR